MASTEQRMSRPQLTVMAVGGMAGTGLFCLPPTFANATGPFDVFGMWLIAGAGMYMPARMFQSLAKRRLDLDTGILAHAKTGSGNGHIHDSHRVGLDRRHPPDATAVDRVLRQEFDRQARGTSDLSRIAAIDFFPASKKFSTFLGVLSNE